MWTALDYTIALQDVRGSPGGRKLSSEAARICAFLILPTTMTPSQEQPFYGNGSPVEVAKRLGTYGKIDRSKQYEGCYSPKLLLNNDNLQFARLRRIERDRFKHHVLAIAFAALLARAPEIVLWIGRLLK